MEHQLSRRKSLQALTAAGIAASCCRQTSAPEQVAESSEPVGPLRSKLTGRDPIERLAPLGFRWQTRDPFLFCVHHDDRYPAGNEAMGPTASLAGRNLGQDFEPRDGWRMYHGRVVPGFPQHPHRGFETVTVVRKGLVDHSDSMGAAGRYGGGDTQWMTAGGGVQHAEMFPLLRQDGNNHLELFQLWLNLPRKNKMVPPHFKMLWAEQIPQHVVADATGKKTTLGLIAGAYGQVAPPAPPPNSWAAQAEADVAIWTVRMGAGATFELPAARHGTNRTLYFFEGSGLSIAGQDIPDQRMIEVLADVPLALAAEGDLELLLLQGRPIGEPVVQQGPFVMNSRAEIAQTIRDYRRTRFGGWPWSRSDPVHERTEGRFARHADGRIEKPVRG